MNQFEAGTEQPVSSLAQFVHLGREGVELVRPVERQVDAANDAAK